MAKNHIITRSGNSLNLNTGRGFKPVNKFADGGLSAEDEEWLYSESERNAEDIINNQKAEASATRRARAESIASGVFGAIPAIGTAVNTYSQLSNKGNASKYEAALNAVPNAISIGNYDALADWRASMPTLENPTASDLDTMSTAGKIGTGLSTIGSLAMAGNSFLPGWGGAIGAGLGALTVGLGLGAGKRNREKLASEISMRNSLSDQRLNSMYLHELGDIQEEQANQAFAQIKAKGGKIHIKPSKRGTFRAQASRMGMSVQEAARHILANKNRYSPAMRKKAAFAKAAAGWKHDEGGELEEPLFDFPVEYNHGGYFSLRPELIKIDQGGTHEQNPLDGVPMGFDENGIPNLVEEGETIFDDYVFSNRLAPTEKQLAEGGLATKYKDHTFADISEKIAKQFEETPVDPIARESFKESMQRLKTIQEQVRSENDNPEAQQMPEQMVAPDSMEYTGQAPTQEEMPAEQMPEEVPQEYPQDMMEQAPMYSEMMQAYGGNLFVGGGNLEEKARKKAIQKVVPYGFSPDDYAAEIEQEYNRILIELRNKEKQREAVRYIEDKYGRNTVAGSGKHASFSSKVSKEDQQKYFDILNSGIQENNEAISFNDEPMGPPVDETASYSKPADLQGRKTDGVAGQTVNAKTGAGNSSVRANTALYKEGTTAEQKRELWFNSSGKALVDSLNNAKKDWDTRGLKGEDLAKEQRAYVDAMNAVQQAYTKAYEAGYDPTTRTSNKDAAVKALQELWEQNKGNKYFNELIKGINIRGNSGDNSARGWIDGLWGDITRNRNWGLNEYFENIKELADKGDTNAKQIYDSLMNAGITYTPEYDYGKNGYKAYKFGLQSDRQGNELIPEIQANLSDPNLNPQATGLEGQAPEIPLTPEQERIQRRAQRQEARQERREARANDGLPTWMRYAPIAGSAIGAIWDIAQKPDYSVAEAAERLAANTPRVRFNPIGNYLTYRPIDRNYYSNQIRNQGLAAETGILNASGANQGAATAGLLANQFNTQNAIGNSLIQQELANRQNEQQVAQFNRGTDQYNSQGLFNESIYNQRAGMQAGHYGLTAAQLRQAERQRRNAAISADLTNLFQGIGDLGWENMNFNMVNSTRAANRGYGYRKKNGMVDFEPTLSKCGGMLTKKKSRRK